MREVAEAANRVKDKENQVIYPLRMDEALVDGLATAAAAGSAGESGDALPILALALQRLVRYHRARGTGEVTLPEGTTARAFLDGAVENAVREAQVSEDALRRLIIPRLATWDPNAGAKGAAKRQVAKAADLFAGDLAGLKPLADALVEQRLLTRTGDAYEVAHEALLRVRPLGDLIYERREKFELARILQVEAAAWAKKPVPGNLVRSGDRLKEAEALVEDSDFGPDLRRQG